MENIMGGIAPEGLEPPMDSSCKCFNILSGPMKLSCLHSQEDSRSATGVSKVSQIATMFQPQQDFEEKQECLGPSQVSVVRTESHVARFNTARALFEKMSEQKAAVGGERRPLKDASNKRIGSGSCGAGGVGRGTPSPSSSGGKSLSRSPSPCSPRSLIHSNGFSSYPTKPVSISGSPIPTISSLSSTSPPTPSTFHTTINNPSITSVLTHHLGTNILSPRTFSEASDPSRGGRWAPVIKSEISKPEILNDKNLLEMHTAEKYGYNKISSQYSKQSAMYSNEGTKLKNEDNVRYNVENSRISSRDNPCKSIKLDSNSKPETSTKFFTMNSFNSVDQCDSNKVSKNHYNNKPDISATKIASSKADNHDSKPSKPTKPDLISDKRLNTSHLQNQKIIQRHKNWFHTFSKSKSPASSPNKTDASHHDTGSSIVGSRLQSSCSRPSYEYEDNSYNHTNSSRKHIKEVIYHKRKSLDDLDSISSEEIQATHNDWRRERAAILAGRANSRLDPGEEADKVKSSEEKVRNYDNVSTLPSSWCPPKQYNAAVKSSRSTSIPSGISDGQHDSSLRRSPLSGGDNTSESESRFSESGSNSGSFREGYVVKREISEVHRSSFDSQLDQRGSSQNDGKGGHRDTSPSPSGSSTLSRRSDSSKAAKTESRASSDLVNERLQRHSNEKNCHYIEEAKNDLEADVKLRKFKAMSTEDVSSRRSFDVKSDVNDGSLKRNSYEVDRERRLKEWERKRIERGNRLSDEIKVHNIRVSDISAFTKNADKEKKENDEVIWVKRETNTGSLDSRRIKEERRRRGEEDKSKEERLRRDEELERKRREALERTHREEKEREDIKKRKAEELERKRRDDVERRKLEEIEKQKAEVEEKRSQAELEKERRKELELERKRKQEEIAKELELRRLEEQREKNRIKEIEEREKLQKEKQEAEEKIRRQKETEEREKLKKEQEESKKQEAVEMARRLREEEERERLRKEKREAEENLRRQKEEEERERQRKEKEEREKKEAEIMAIRQKEEEEERARQQKEEEERERIRLEKEERERRETEERVRKEMEEEKIRKQIEEENKKRLLREEKERLQEEERIRKMTYQERMDEEERLKREKDRLEIEKTKRRIAELKREREELQRQQLMRMQQVLVDGQEAEVAKVIIEKEEVIRINLDEISNEERESESIAALDALVHGHRKKPNHTSEHSEQELDHAASKVDASLACLDSQIVNKEISKGISQLDHQESVEVSASQEYLDENKSSNIEYALVGLDTSELTDVEVTDIETTDVDVTEVDQSTSSNSSTCNITDKSVSEKPELMLAKSDERRMFKTDSSLDEVLQTPVDEVYYDPTVTSAQYKIEFCSSPLGIPINRDEAKTGSPYRSQIIDSSTLSSEFEPLPPPIPPHNVNPATIMSGGDSGEIPAAVCGQNESGISTDHAAIESSADDRLEQMADLIEYVDADPEVMTPEEESKLLSHKAETSLLSDDQAKEVSQILAQTKDVQDGSCLSSQNYHPEVNNELPDTVQPSVEEESLRESSPPVDYDEEGDEEPSGVPVGQVTTEGFVVRTKEVHYEDGIHYFEDGNFWIEVPGLQENDDEDEEDEFPEHIPFHKHTKLKFSTAPIQLFSTFSVTDYDRKNEDVDPVAASAEYELEKRVEKMDVFPVQIEKGEGGLGLSIIGMGVGADAGVEKLGIFVKTISPGGATDKDGRIKVNDQIIEVDNQSLVGVTQMYAASVLKNTNGSVSFLIGREQDPDNSEVAMLIRQSLMADMEREERRRALGGPNYDPNNGGVFESFSSPSGGDSPSEETSRNNISQYDEVGDVNPYGEEGCEDDYADSYGSCPSSPQPRMPSSPPDALKSSAENSTSEMVVLGQHLMEVQHKNRLHEEEIIKLRSKISELERELGDKVEISKSLEDMTSRLIDIEDKLQSRQAEIATYQDMLEQSQGQYIVLEKKYYKAKKIIKEYQSRERDFLHREEYHITQLEEKDALYNSLVKALKDRVIQLEGDLIKAQQKAGLPVVLPPDLNAQSLNFVHSSHKGFGGSDDDQANVDQKEPPRKPATLGTLDPDLSDTEGCDTQTSESSKASTVERKIPLKEELDVAVPPHELLDVSFSKAKGELATRGGLAKRQLPSLKKTASSSSAGSFDRSLDDSVDEGLPESHQQHLFSTAENAATSSAANISSSSVSSNSYIHHEEVFQQSISSSNQSLSSHSYSVSSSQHQTSQGNSFPQHNGFSRPPPPYHPPQGHNPPSYSSPSQSQYSQQGQLPHPSSYGNNHNESQHIQTVSNQSQSQPPPYQPPPSAPLSHRSLVTVETNTGRSDMPYRHPPPIARVQPVNRVEAPTEKTPTPTSPQYGPRTPQQQSLAHQLKTLLAEREANTEQSLAPQSPIKKSASMLMEDVRQAVIQADLSIGKKPMISAPIHMSSTAQVVSTGQFVQHRGSPVRNSGGDNSTSQQRISHDFGSWSPKSSRSSQNNSSSIVAPSNSSGVVLLSQRPIDSSLPPLNNEDCNLSSSVDRLHSGSQGSLVGDESTSSFDSQPSPSHLQEKNRFPGYSREAASVLDWSKEQVGQWLVLQGLEGHVGKFASTGITGPRLVNIDTKDLKSMGLSTDEKNKIKRKVKELRQNLERERKQIEKERKEREKLQKKAEKLAKEAEKRKK